jgi:hypothetical protein
VTIEPRPWIALEDLADPDNPDLLFPLPESVSDYAAESAIEIATAVLYEITGRRWSGTASASVRPSAVDTSSKAIVPGWVESWGSYDSSVGACTPTDVLDLGYFPVTAITQVRIDGVVVSPSVYQLQEQKLLVRIDGGTWPCTQNLSAAPTLADTFEVNIVHGIDPPVAGKHCCAFYAAELAKSFCNLDCALPQRTQYVTRQGVSTILADPLNVIERGMVGLPNVDSWVRAVNPHGRRKRSMMVSNRNVDEGRYVPPLSSLRLEYDYFGYPQRSINRFHG